MATYLIAIDSLYSIDAPDEEAALERMREKVASGEIPDTAGVEFQTVDILHDD